MNQPPAKPVDRPSLYLAIATFVLINLAVIINITNLGPQSVVKGILVLGLITGGIAWFRLKKANG